MFSKKLLAFAFLIASLIAFQNCGPKNDFQQETKKTLTSSVQQTDRQTLEIPEEPAVQGPVATPTPVPSEAPRNYCITYVLQNGKLAGLEVAAGSTIYQQVGCNDRPVHVGYQQSYCDSELGGCGNCKKPYATYTCSAGYEWQ